MFKLELLPDQSGYSVDEPSGAVRIETAGGAAAVYADLIGASSIANLTWICDAAEYEELVSFYVNELRRGAEAFLLDLVLDEPFPIEYEVILVPNSFKLASVSGETYTVTAQAEVSYKEVDPLYDEFVISLYPSSGYSMLNALNQLVNVVIPDNMS